MKYYFDTEFIENGTTIDLLSIGIVDENERTLYLQNAEANFSRSSDWVWRNVFPHLIHFHMGGLRSCNRQSVDCGLATTTACGSTCPWRSRSEIRDAIKDFCDESKHGKPEFWGYYADYDWVVFCQLFGAMIYLPKGWPMYCRDLKQLLDSIGNPKVQKDGDIHHALHDAMWIRETWASLRAENKING